MTQKVIHYLECDEDGDFTIHAAMIVTAERTSSLDISSAIDHMKHVVSQAARHAEPVITYAYNGQLMFNIRVAVDYSVATRDTGFAILRALEEDGWEIVSPSSPSCSCCGGVE